MIQIELKSIKVNQRLSEETFNYSAKLYADGKHIADIGNDGHGGADRILSLGKNITWEDYRAVEARVTAEHPKEDLLGNGTLHDASLEGVCHMLVDDHMVAKEVARLLKSKVVFFKNGRPANDETQPLYEIKIDTKRGVTPDMVISRLRAREPDAYILNELSPADAIRAYKQAA